MYNSKRLEDLRADVAVNCRTFLALCKEQGLPVLVTGTVRDEEYQLEMFEKGYSKAKRPAFHAQGVGLAFDFCKNVPGHEFDDLDFFARCGALGETMGFEWGGRWTSFPDRPHLQWSGPKHDYKSSDIWAGRLPPAMPRYVSEVEEEMTQAQFEEMLDRSLKAREAALRAAKVSDWASEAWTAAQAAGLFDGTAPRVPMTREQAALVLKRLKLL